MIFENSNRYLFEMRFACTKNSKNNNKAVHDFHKNVDVHMKCHFSQDSNVVHICDSLNFHLRNDDLIRIKKKKRIINKFVVIQNKSLRKSFQKFSRHARFDFRNRNTRFFH
jgi:hypothetical protein